MSGPWATVAGYAELARLSNLPTCASNVLVGVAIASVGQPMPWTGAVPIAGAICLFYVGGMALNDVCDYRSDLQQRPDRPIVAGRVSFGGAVVLVIAAILAGLGLLVWQVEHNAAVVMAAALLLAITLYNMLHKKFAVAVVLMGACRGLVYLTAAVAIGGWQIDWVIAGVLAGVITFYTTAITIIARLEATGRMDIRRWMAVDMLIIPLLVVIFVRPATWLVTAIAAAVMAAWLIRAAMHVFAQPPRTKLAVLAWLSGMCLVDAYLLSLLGYPVAVLVAGGCFVLTALGHRAISGT